MHNDLGRLGSLCHPQRRWLGERNFLPLVSPPGRGVSSAEPAQSYKITPRRSPAAHPAPKVLPFPSGTCAPKGAARAGTGMLLLVCGSRAPQRRKAWISAGRVIPAVCKYQQHTGVGHLQPRASGSLAGSNSVSQARCLCALVTTPVA